MRKGTLFARASRTLRLVIKRWPTFTHQAASWPLEILQLFTMFSYICVLVSNKELWILLEAADDDGGGNSADLPKALEPFHQAHTLLVHIVLAN